MSGGSIGSILGLSARNGSTVDLTGGSYGRVRIDEGGVVTASGGTFGDGPAALTGGSLTLSGTDFRINGVPVDGLSTIGQTKQVNLASMDLLTGVLADGTPFAFAGRDDSDTFYAGTLRLRLATTQAIGPAMIVASMDEVPLGIRQGQTLIVDSGGIAPHDFNAGVGSTVVIEPGGTIGDNFEAVGAEVTISGGSVGYAFDAFAGTTLNVSGGTIGNAFEALPGSAVVIEEGTFGRGVHIHAGSNVAIHGGRFGDGFEAQSSSYVPITGGVFAGVRVRTGASMSLSGGAFGKFVTDSVSAVQLLGAEFLLNGQPIAGLEEEGNSVLVDLPSSGILSGVLSDGTPILLSPLDADAFSIGTLSLQRTAVPAAIPGTIRVSTDGTPPGLRTGQTLIVDDGSSVRDHFNAEAGTTIYVEAGGSIGTDLEIAGGQVVVQGGAIGDDFDAFGASEVVIWNGTIGRSFTAHASSVVRLNGGEIGSGSRTFGMLSMAGGQLKEAFQAGNGSVVNISGGSVGNGFDALTGSAVSITGGTIGDDFDAAAGSTIRLFGTEFLLGDMPIEGLTYDEPFLLAARNASLSGVLLDGSEFSFDLYSFLRAPADDFFATNAALVLTLSLPGDVTQDGLVDAADYVVLRKRFGTSFSEAHFDVWRTNFGSESDMLAPGPAVPEPLGTWHLFVAASVFGYCGRKRRQKRSLWNACRVTRF
jgi:hypothetical protein